MIKRPLPCVLVCVSDILRCERLITAGKLLSQNVNAPLRVISVQPREAFVGKAAGALEHLFSAARAAGADMSVYYDDARTETVLRYLRENPVYMAVLGAPGPGSSAMAMRLRAAFPGLDIRLVREEAPMMEEAIV